MTVCGHVGHVRKLLLSVCVCVCVCVCVYVHLELMNDDGKRSFSEASVTNKGTLLSKNMRTHTSRCVCL
jgi:hypothetical protein